MIHYRSRLLIKNYQNKITRISYIFCFIFIVIVVRLLYLQAHLQEKLFLKSQKNFLRTEKIDSLRGNILDCKGRILATNRPANNLFWFGTGKHILTEEQEFIIKNLGEILGRPLTSSSLYSAIKQTEKHVRQLLLAEDISYEQLSKIVERFPQHPNLVIKQQGKRFYPHKNIGSHIIGYLGSVKYQEGGKMGFEKLYEETLKGEHGVLLKIINSYGRSLEQREIKKALIGQDLQLTLDLDLQMLIESIFPPLHQGTFLLMETETGAIRTLLSRPSFDPNIFLDPILFEDWQLLQEKQPFINRAFEAAYPPASLFKLITVTAALEENLIHENDHWKCRGFYPFGGKKLRCRKAHGTINTQEAVAQSCNILFYEIGRKLTINTLAYYAHQFGLGEKTQHLFLEREGLIPTFQWKYENKGEPWWPGETLSAAIGQSYLLTTPIQIARMIASIWTGYLVKPRLLEKEELSHQPLTISQKTRLFLQNSMEQVVEKGTGVRLKGMPHLKMQAKTGTAQTSNLSKRKLGDQFKEHGWFVANFCYKNEAPLTLVVLVEHAGGSRIPANIAKKFLLSYIKNKETEELKG